jgi:hypothetical protein
VNDAAVVFGRLISGYKAWKARRKAKAKKRYDEQIRRIVAKESAWEQRQNQRARKQQRKSPAQRTCPDALRSQVGGAGFDQLWGPR